MSNEPLEDKPVNTDAMGKPSGASKVRFGANEDLERAAEDAPKSKPGRKRRGRPSKAQIEEDKRREDEKRREEVKGLFEGAEDALLIGYKMLLGAVYKAATRQNLVVLPEREEPLKKQLILVFDRYLAPMLGSHAEIFALGLTSSIIVLESMAIYDAREKKEQQNSDDIRPQGIGKVFSRKK